MIEAETIYVSRAQLRRFGAPGSQTDELDLKWEAFEKLKDYGKTSELLSIVGRRELRSYARHCKKRIIANPKAGCQNDTFNPGGSIGLCNRCLLGSGRT